MAALIESEIIINAPIEKVWQVLADLDSYEQWNSFTPKVETNFEPGSAVILHVNLNPGKQLHIQKETILEYVEGERMSWGITSSFPAKTIRIQQLTKVDDTTTRYYTSDELKGLLVPLITALYGKKIQHGFDQVAKGLKAYCESV